MSRVREDGAAAGDTAPSDASPQPSRSGALRSPGEFVQQMALGIRRAVELSSASVSGGLEAPITAQDHSTYTVRNALRGADGTEFRVLEYSPAAFRALRELYGWSEADYAAEWELDGDQIQHQEGAGRSGAMFTKSKSKRLMCKTIFAHEVSTLLSMLPQYVEHVRINRDSLIMPLLGLYKFGEGQVATGTDTVFVLVFSNVMYSAPEDNISLGPVYDLKGRRVKTRRFHDEAGAKEEKGVCKDKHLERLFYAGDLSAVLVKQISVDVGFLNAANLIDYSLLVGVGHCLAADCQACSQPAQAAPGVPLFRSCHGGFSAGEDILYVGIIDCLTFFGAAKKMANTFKRILWEQDQLSTVEQNFYAHRFMSYVKSIFPHGPKPLFAPFVPNKAVSTRKMYDLDVLTCGYTQLLAETLGKTPPTYPEAASAATFEELRRHVGRQFVRMDQQEQLTYSITEYCPSAFVALRERFSIEDQVLLESWQGLSELQVRATMEVEVMENVLTVAVASVGRKFLMQRIQPGHMRDLRAFFPDYFRHMTMSESHLQRLVGLYTFKIGRVDVHVVISVCEFPLKEGIQWSELFTVRGAIPRKTDLASPSAAQDQGASLSAGAVTASKEDVARVAAEYQQQETERRICGTPLRLFDVDIQFRRFQLVLDEEQRSTFARYQATLARDMELLVANNLTGFGLQFALAQVQPGKADHGCFPYVESHGDVSLPRSEEASAARGCPVSVMPASSISPAGDGTAVLCFGGIVTLWKRFGKRDTLASLIRGQAQTIVDPNTYCKRLRSMLGELFLLRPEAMHEAREEHSRCN